MSRKAICLVVAIAAIACGSPATTPPDVRAPLLSSIVHRLTSRNVESDFLLTIVLPRSYEREPTRRYPVIYLLDGNQLAPVAAGVLWDLSIDGNPEAILVGIDYPVSSIDGSQSLRYRDLTPMPDPAAVERNTPGHAALHLPPPEVSGGGPAFLRFVVDEAVPFVDDRYRALPSDRTLLGVSFGGLFTLYALTERPDAFHRYIAISPSLWWGERRMLDRLAALGGRDRGRSRLFVSVGLSEGTDGIFNMVGNVRALEQSLAVRTPAGLEWYVHYFPEETHASSWPGAISRGLRFVFETWSPEKSTK